MRIFARSKQTIMSQLCALRSAIDDELSCKLPSHSKIQSWEIRFAECAEELAHLEVRSWRSERP